MKKPSKKNTSLRARVVSEPKPNIYLARITRDPDVMGGRPCIRGMRITVGTIVGLLATGKSITEVLSLYPMLESEDIREALAYSAWRTEELEVQIRSR